MGGVVNRNKTSLVLVTGATGAVGPQVVAAVSAAGHRIRSLSLDPPEPNIWPRAIETQIGDVTDPIVVQLAMRGADAVIHLAALLHIANPPPELKPKYEKINVGGTKTVMEAARQSNVKRVVYFSTIAVYGDSKGQVLHEETWPQPKTFYEHTKLEAEKVVLNATSLSGQPIGTVLRLAAVYGSRIKGNYRQLVKELAKGRFIPIGHGKNRRTLVYDKDVGLAAVFALEHPGAAGKIFNVSDGEFHTLNEIIAAICSALGKKAPCFSLPNRPVRFAAGVVEDVARLLKFQTPIRRAIIDKYTEDMAVDSRRIQQELGFVPKFDLEAGWKDTVQEMQRSGEL
jgi:nucleoside-diphosphate-sugar epimerase